MNVFLALPKSTPESKSEDYCREIMRLFSNKVTVTTSGDDFKANFADAGGWDAWTTSVAEGIDFVSRKPKYEAIICVERVIGKATAQIVKKSLNSKKTVIILEDGGVRQITNVVENDSNNWISGWELC